MSNDAQPIIVKRIKKHGHAGHHGGAWKVAYADFVTAMMAFFLMMWLVGSTTKEQKAALSEYFTAPSEVEGSSPHPTSHPTSIQGPGGASTSMIQMGGALNLESERAQPIKSEPGDAKTFKEKEADKDKDKDKDGKGGSIDAMTAEQVARNAEQKRLEALRDELTIAIGATQALAPYKDQLLIDLTPEGLRIQIIDEENRPMFDRGSKRLQSYSTDILGEIGKIINAVPNKISISGHTDAAPYTGTPDYTNWELSADRANAARRALIAGGMDEKKIARIVGLASSVPFTKADPYAPSNRRISIIVMNRDLEVSISNEQSQSTPVPGDTAAPATDFVAPATPASAQGQGDAAPKDAFIEGDPAAPTDAAPKPTPAPADGDLFVR
ncbi:MAG TPA: flagellar motor protein MotB [Gammaproteobacteria bacterium]|nr:flagellar motor protein MotB [Gammaproteobacteria bacterium]